MRTNYLNTPDFPALGYVGGVPEFEITAVQSVEEGRQYSVRSGTNYEVPVLTISLRKDDTEGFRRFTASHVGQKVAIVIDGAVVAAPQLQAPIPTGMFSIDLPGQKEQEDLAERLQALRE